MIDRGQRRSARSGGLLWYLGLSWAVLLGLASWVVLANEQLALLRLNVLGVAVAVWLSGMAVAVFAVRHLTRPALEMKRAAEEVLAGHAVFKRPRSAIAEMDQLGEAIEGLAANLGSRLMEAENATETLQLVLGALTQGTVLISPEDRIEYSNPWADRLLGSSPETLGELTPFGFQTAIRDSRARGTAITINIDHGQPTRRLRGVATPFADRKRVLLIIDDITDRERAAAIRRDFVANASHELKTPVASIIASGEALRIAARRDPDAAIRFVDQIEASARQLNGMVSDLLDLSRLEREDAEKSLLSLDLLTREEVDRIRHRAEGEGLTIEIEVTPARVTGNARDLSAAVRNVLDNAIRHTGPGGTISVRVGPTDSMALVAISDTGEGIPTRDHERIFERFYRVDAARSRATGGTGLGLSIVKHAVESHGGRVEVESELGVGSTFYLHLPLPPEDSDPATH